MSKKNPALFVAGFFIENEGGILGSMTDQQNLHWYDPDWQKLAHDWIRAEATPNSIQLTGESKPPPQELSLKSR
jgi:hypothetical protein